MLNDNRIEFLDLMINAILEHERTLAQLIDRLESVANELSEKHISKKKD